MKRSASTLLYLDNAATSFPKPAEVAAAMLRAEEGPLGNPGRSGHRLSIEAGDIVLAARMAVAHLFVAANPLRVIFTAGATEALNLAIQGILRPGDHAVTSAMEHNGTARPLRALEKAGVISLTFVPCGRDGLMDPEDFRKALRPNTRLAVINHGSNVYGTVQEIPPLGALCRERSIPLLLDAAQTAGIVPIDIERDGMSMAAFAGHKGLLGPMGTGGLVLASSFDHRIMRPLFYGGTGSMSDSIDQPDFLPDCYESGTLNVPGLAGLAAGIDWILREPASAGQGTRCARQFLVRAAEQVKGFREYVCREAIRTGTVSFNVEGASCSDLCQALSERYNIMCRAGLHCAPLAHRAMGTFPEGTVRFSFGRFNHEDDARRAAEALAEITLSEKRNQ